MAEAKHAFVDDYPYLVYTNEDTLIYSNKTDTSIDDIPSGESDFAIASMYVKNNSSYGAAFECPTLGEDDTLEVAFSVASGGDETTKSIITYKGKNEYVELTIEGGEFSNVTISTTGGVEWHSDTESLEVTGDGTITFVDSE